jgi:hypothetical protein
MTIRTRKLLGTICLILLVAAYTLGVMMVAAFVLPQAGSIAELAFYAIAGLAWVLPAGLLITWMHR